MKAKNHIPEGAIKTYASLKLMCTIRQAEDKQHIYIVTQPGFSKIAAVLEWLKDSQYTFAWIELDESDNALDVFWERIKQAFLSIQSDNDKLEAKLNEEGADAALLAENAAYYLCESSEKQKMFFCV